LSPAFWQATFRAATQEFVLTPPAFEITRIPEKTKRQKYFFSNFKL
jgi:hypothetical protein